MLKGQNSHLGGFDTYQLIREREKCHRSSQERAARPSHRCQIKAGTRTRLFLPLQKRLPVFSSQLERELGLQTQAHECATERCDFFLHGRKRDKIEPAQLKKKKIHLQVLKVNYSGQLIPAAQEQSWLSKYQTLYEIPPPAMQILQETAALKRLFM